MIRADLRALRWTAPFVVLLIALAVAIAVAFGAQERALRTASARAADDFPLLIGAPGSQAQLVLTAVYLQPDALPLIDGTLLNRLAADPRVAGVAPVAFGDTVRGWPVIGTTADFATRWGRLRPVEGSVFAREDEAVIGAAVTLAVGAEIVPSHGIAAHGNAGEESAEEAAHRHDGVRYKVVGRLPATGTPWDRAILVPVETVWETHGLGNGHATDPARLGPPFDAASPPGVPAIVVKPRSVADAYVLRGAFRQGGTMALFPAEVLVSLYRVMGDLHEVVRLASALNNLVVLLAILLLSVLLLGMRRQRYAVLRALGAPRHFVLTVIWLGTSALIGAGCLLGLALGGLAAQAVAAGVAARTGLVLAPLPGWREVGFAALIFAAGSGLALLPAILAGRGSITNSLRSSA